MSVGSSGAVSPLRVTVAVPVRDEERSLPSLFASLKSQAFRPAEIIVADGGSRDASVATAEQLGARVLRLGPAYPGRGRNAAIAAAQCDWVALIDAGCTACPEWLGALVQTAQTTPCDVVLGNYRPKVTHAWELIQALTLVPPPSPADGCRPPFIASSLLHRHAWRSVGGFREDLRAAEDLLFIEALRSARISTSRCADAMVEWSLPTTPLQTFKRLRLYSTFHAAAGLSASWHRRVALMDMACGVCVAGATLWPTLAVVPILAAAMRVQRRVRQRRAALRTERLSAAGWIRASYAIALSDVAMWAGLLDLVAGHVRRDRGLRDPGKSSAKQRSMPCDSSEE
jgi:hypothetical protein